MAAWRQLTRSEDEQHTSVISADMCRALHFAGARFALCLLYPFQGLTDSAACRGAREPSGHKSYAPHQLPQLQDLAALPLLRCPRQVSPLPAQLCLVRVQSSGAVYVIAARGSNSPPLQPRLQGQPWRRDGMHRSAACCGNWTPVLALSGSNDDYDREGPTRVRARHFHGSAGVLEFRHRTRWLLTWTFGRCPQMMCWAMMLLRSLHSTQARSCREN